MPRAAPVTRAIFEGRRDIPVDFSQTRQASTDGKDGGYRRCAYGTCADCTPVNQPTGGAVLCIGSCRDLPVTPSIIAILSIPARDPLLGRSKAVSAGLGGLPTAGRADGSNSHNLSRGRYVYVGLSIASGYCYARTIERNAPESQDSGVVVFAVSQAGMVG
jgi:hypothetical protein